MANAWCNSVNQQQVVDFVKNAQAIEKSVDGTDVVGGTAGKLELAKAAYVLSCSLESLHTERGC
jgi:hypothetical protein